MAFFDGACLPVPYGPLSEKYTVRPETLTYPIFDLFELILCKLTNTDTDP